MHRVWLIQFCITNIDVLGHFCVVCVTSLCFSCYQNLLQSVFRVYRNATIHLKQIFFQMQNLTNQQCIQCFLYQEREDCCFVVSAKSNGWLLCNPSMHEVWLIRLFTCFENLQHFFSFRSSCGTCRNHLVKLVYYWDAR